MSNAFHTALCRLCAQQSATIAQMPKSFFFQYTRKNAVTEKKRLHMKFHRKNEIFRYRLAIWDIFESQHMCMHDILHNIPFLWTPKR